MARMTIQVALKIRQVSGMTDETAEAWLQKLQSGNCSDADYKAFDLWYKSDNHHREAFERTKYVESLLDVVASSPEIHQLRKQVLEATEPKQTFVKEENGQDATSTGFLSQLFQDLAQLISSIVDKPGNRMAVFMSTAAAAVVMTVLFIRPSAIQSEFYETPVGKHRSVVLNDGSKITLDTNTSLVVTYTRESRLVELRRGQGYFDVTKNSKRPFVVTSSNAQVRVLGTIFSVRQSNSELVVTLKEGSVSVLPIDDRNQEKVKMHTVPQHLQPGEQLIYSPAKGIERKTIAQIDKEMNWASGNLVFNSARLEDVITQISRYTNEAIIISDPDLKEIKVNAVFQVGKLDTFMKALESTLNIDIKKNTQGRYELSPVSSEPVGDNSPM